MVVDILRAQPGESLTTVLYTPATAAQVSLVYVNQAYVGGRLTHAWFLEIIFMQTCVYMLVYVCACVYACPRGY